MSRFADPKVTDRLVLGDCQCPGKPHDEDWIDMRTEVGAADLVRIAEGDGIDLLALLAVAWNLLLPDGTLAPIDREHAALLFGDTFDAINEWTNTHIRTVTLPNGPAVPSRNGSRANGSRPRMARAR